MGLVPPVSNRPGVVLHAVLGAAEEYGVQTPHPAPTPGSCLQRRDREPRGVRAVLAGLMAGRAWALLSLAGLCRIRGKPAPLSAIRRRGAPGGRPGHLGVHEQAALTSSRVAVPRWRASVEVLGTGRLLRFGEHLPRTDESRGVTRSTSLKGTPSPNAEQETLP